MSKLNELKSNPLLYYIYQMDYSIFNIEEQDPKYIVIIDNDCLKSSIASDEDNFEIYTTKEWFDKLVNSEIITWICSCLDKKFIIKEYVKLLGIRDDLKIRNNFDRDIDLSCVKIIDSDNKQEVIFDLLVKLLFSHQIMDFNKIINFTEPKEYWYKICKADNPWDEFLYFATESITKLHNRTSNLAKNKKLCQEL